ncbi:hypothetical protein [Amazonocrinis nigriterrae]|nr:hypothetical protein [Amazonocrinis nigriterrae]
MTKCDRLPRQLLEFDTGSAIATNYPIHSTQLGRVVVPKRS